VWPGSSVGADDTPVVTPEILVYVTTPEATVPGPTSARTVPAVRSSNSKPYDAVVGSLLVNVTLSPVR
jgi:hypothetical protein